uniref:Uncharacterized protein n=1 Tax=Anopheles dirus TaxID=7168 RepID=A0A182NYJ9_9DIPT
MAKANLPKIRVLLHSARENKPQSLLSNPPSNQPLVMTKSF